MYETSNGHLQIVFFIRRLLQSAHLLILEAGHQYQGVIADKAYAVWAQDAPINGPDAGLWGVTQAHFRPQWDPQYLQGLQLYFKEKGIHNFIFWAYNANGSAHQSSRLF